MSQNQFSKGMSQNQSHRVRKIDGIVHMHGLQSMMQSSSPIGRNEIFEIMLGSIFDEFEL